MAISSADTATPVGVEPGAVLDVRDLLVSGLPHNGRLLGEGDFRDWPEVEARPAGIADQRAPADRTGANR
jgi:hypothetical protein